MMKKKHKNKRIRQMIGIYLTQSLHVSQVESNIEEREKRVDELKEDRFGNQMILIIGVSSIIFQII